KPRRRKLGVVTLVMACLFLAARIRSDIVSDFFEKGTFGEGSILVENSIGLFGLMTTTITPRTQPHPRKPFRNWATEQISEPADYSNQLRNMRKHHQRFKVFGIADYWWKSETSLGPMTIHLFEIDWFVVLIPLTVLSARLLLSKQR